MAATDTPDQPARPAPPSHEGSIRETLESIIIAFVLAFMFRAFIIEAFVIPTGSMAPTLLGAHYRAECPMCGYDFTINATEGSRPHGEVDCAMCDYPISLGVRGAMQESGDRILVLKYVYEFAEPSRWDVVVFKNPKDPDQNYIKRLVGLPNEELWIVGGNVFTRPLDAHGESTGDGEAWRIQRKPHDVQQAVWVPVYHSEYYPLDGGDVGVQGPLETYQPRHEAWQVPWQPRNESADQWRFQQRGPRWHYDGDQPGTLGFAFTDDRVHNYYSYNATPGGRGPVGDHPIEDMRIGATVIPDEAGLAVTLRVASQSRQFRGSVDAEGRVTLQSRPVPRNDDPIADADANAEPWETVAEADADSLPVGRATRLELWHADQRASLWVEGRNVAEWSYERDAASLSEEQGDLVEPTVEISVAGGPATLREVNLDRDLYYTNGSQQWSLGVTEPTIIGPDHFFCLGDNSPASEDSRRWTGVDPWLTHLTDVPVGYVPREMMIGRAFFVYFPAMWRFREGGMAVVPNFADMRFIR